MAVSNVVGDLSGSQQSLNHRQQSGIVRPNPIQPCSLTPPSTRSRRQRAYTPTAATAACFRSPSSRRHFGLPQRPMSTARTDGRSPASGWLLRGIVARPARSADGRSAARADISADQPWASATSPTTPPDPCSKPAASDPGYTLHCEEPPNAPAGGGRIGLSKPGRRRKSPGACMSHISWHSAHTACRQ